MTAVLTVTDTEEKAKVKNLRKKGNITNVIQRTIPGHEQRILAVDHKLYYILHDYSRELLLVNIFYSVTMLLNVPKRLKQSLYLALLDILL
jgi:hypothetical protein